MTPGEDQTQLKCYGLGDMRNLYKLSALMICFTLLGGCARDLVTAPHQDWSVPLVVYGRMLEKDALAQMPDYERNQEVCKRTDGAFRRVDYLNDLSDRITASGNELERMQKDAYSCERKRMADCITCDSYWVEQCGNSEVSPAWDSILAYRNNLVRRYRRVETQHMDAHNACVTFIIERDMDIDLLWRRFGNGSTAAARVERQRSIEVKQEQRAEGVESTVETGAGGGKLRL